MAAALHMTWQQQHQQQRRRRGTPPLGLKNLGNTCYLNSVLQCLTFTPPLAQFCLSNQHSSLCKSLFANREKECPFCILERQIARLLSVEGSLVDSPAKIQKCITLFAEHFRWGRQEDAHEFLRYVIDACHNTCLKLLKKHSPPSVSGNGNGNGAAAPSTVMRDIFGGALLSQVKCLTCKGESNKTDEMMDISLDLFQTNSLKDALGRFFQPELLDGNNKYNCSKCKKPTQAKKQMFILRAPNVLVIQLKRFEGIHGGKINRNIEFEEVLMLSKFMSSTTQDLHPEYSLFGSIVHSGFSPESGHYYAYIKDPLGRWYCCNDAHVSLSNTQEVLSEKVYILFYLRSNQSSRLGKSGAPCNTKSADSSCNEAPVRLKPSGLSKPPTLKPNGLSSSKNVSTISKNGKISINPQIKYINFKNSEFKNAITNGNGDTVVRSNGSVEKNNGDHQLSPAVKKNTPECNGSTENFKVENKTDSSAPKISAVNGMSPNIVDNNKKNTLNGSNGNGYNYALKASTHKENATECLASADKNANFCHPSNSLLTNNDSHTTSVKRKSCDSEGSEALGVGTRESPRSGPAADASCKRLLSCASRTDDLEDLKERIASEALSALRSCGWCDEVASLMRTKKRNCMPGTRSCPDNLELKRQLILYAKSKCNSQIPEPLKQDLVNHIRSLLEGKPLYDA